MIFTDAESVKVKFEALRDSFTKYKNKLQASSASGAGANTQIRKYVYADILEFTDLAKRKKS